MNTSKLLVSSSIACASALLALSAHASRTAPPSAGRPPNPGLFNQFEYNNGTVHNLSLFSQEWNLPTYTETSASLGSVLKVKGTTAAGVGCSNYWTSALSGAATFGTGVLSPATCSGNPDQIAPGAVNPAPVGSMGIKCTLPPARSGCDPRITYYRYTSDPHGSTRGALPIDGSPFPLQLSTGIWNEFDFTDLGGVFRRGSNQFRNWDLTPHIDNTGSKHAVIRAKGSSSFGTTCWSVSVDGNGGAVVSTTVGTQPTCNGAPTNITTPLVSVPSGSTFTVTCRLPPAETNCAPPALVQYRFNQ